MANRTRRTAIGNLLIDVAKYLLTAVGVGGLVSERVVWRMVVLGLLASLIIGILGFWVIPPDPEEEDTT